MAATSKQKAGWGKFGAKNSAEESFDCNCVFAIQSDLRRYWCTHMLLHRVDHYLWTKNFLFLLNHSQRMSEKPLTPCVVCEKSGKSKRPIAIVCRPRPTALLTLCHYCGLLRPDKRGETHRQESLLGSAISREVSTIFSYISKSPSTRIARQTLVGDQLFFSCGPVLEFVRLFRVRWSILIPRLWKTGTFA